MSASYTQLTSTTSTRIADLQEERKQGIKDLENKLQELKNIEIKIQALKVTEAQPDQKLDEKLTVEERRKKLELKIKSEEELKKKNEEVKKCKAAVKNCEENLKEQEKKSELEYAKWIISQLEQGIDASKKAYSAGLTVINTINTLATALGLCGSTSASGGSTTIFCTICAAIPVAGWIVLLAASSGGLAYGAYRYGVKKGLEEKDTKFVPQKKLETFTKIGIGASVAGMTAAVTVAVCAALPVAGWVLLLSASVLAFTFSSYEFGLTKGRNQFFFYQKKLTESAALTRPTP